MATAITPYEEARKKRLQENLKKIEGLGITAIKDSLSEIGTSKIKKYSASPVLKKSFVVTEVRRSSRARNLISSYREDEFDDVTKYLRSYNRRGCSKRAYNGAVASYEERVRAMQRAENFQNKLDPQNPSFVKQMVRSHVSSCFWLGLPSRFCKDHLPLKEVRVILEDESAEEWEVIYIGSRAGLSGGWKGFALDHDLDDGDALLFELVQPDRFKVYIFKGAGHADEDEASDPANDLEKGTEKPEDALEGKHASDHNEILSKSPSSKRGTNGTAKENIDVNLSDPQSIPVKSAPEMGDGDVHHVQESSTRGMGCNGLPNMVPMQGDNEVGNGKPSSSQLLVAKSSQENMDPLKESTRSKRRAKRAPKRSRIL